MKKRTLLVLLLLLPTAALAQKNPVELTLFGGYRVGGEIDAVDNDLFPIDVELDEAPSYGAMLGIPVVGGLSIEILADHQATEFVTSRPLFGNPQNLGDIDVTYYHVGILYQWLDGQIHPFVAHGVGVAHLAPEFGSSEDKLSASLGGGVKIMPAEHIGFRFEGRGFWADTSDSDYWDDDYCCYYDDRGKDLFQFEVTVGLIFAF